MASTRLVRNWSELLEELLVGVATRISVLEDFLAFGRVYRSWRSVAIKKNFKGCQQAPWLMLAERGGGGEENMNQRRIVSLTKGEMVRKLTLPGARRNWVFESRGWLVTVSKDGEMKLLHPLSQVQISLPHTNTFKYYAQDRTRDHFSFIKKAVLSSSPEDALENNDYVVMVIYGGYGWLGFWKPGDKTWTTIETRIAPFSDLIYYNGKFYGVDREQGVFACDIGGPIETVAQFVGRLPPEFHAVHQSYIVASEGGLLMVVRNRPRWGFFGEYGFGDPEFDCDAKEFRLFAVDLNNRGGWTEKKSLGDNALFLGDNASISVQASKFPGIKSNCIYYTDDFWDAFFLKRGGAKATGIYNLKDGSVMRCYKEEPFSSISPPIWVNPSF